MGKRKEATKLVQWLRKSDSLAVKTLLWLPSIVQPLRWCLRNHDASKRQKTVVTKHGINPERTYFIIRISYPEYGLASLETFVTAFCGYAERRGWTPVVDMQNARTMYHDAGEEGNVNVWERYYEQPCGCSLDETLKSHRVVICNTDRDWQNMLHFWYFGNPANRAAAQRYYRKYIRLRADVSKDIEAECARLIQSRTPLLGAVVRGTDFKMLKPAMHSIPPETQQAIDYCAELMREWACEGLVLATEDLDILEAFSQAFGGRLIYNESLRFRAQPGLLISKYASDRPRDRFRRGMEYLTTLVLLSKCDALTGSGCSAFNFASLRRPDRDRVYQFDNGTYE